MMYPLTRKQNFLNVSRQIPYSRNHTGKDLLLYLATDNFVSPNKNEIISCRAGEVVCLIYIDEQREGSRVQTRFPSETSLLAGVNHHCCCTQAALHCYLSSLKLTAKNSGVRPEEKMAETASLGQGLSRGAPKDTAHSTWCSSPCHPQGHSSWSPSQNTMFKMQHNLKKIRPASPLYM